MTTPQSTLIRGFLGRLRFPQLFLVAAGLFLLDLILPDLIPFVDEILLAIGTLVLGSLEKKTGVDPAGAEKPPMKDVTPEDGNLN